MGIWILNYEIIWLWTFNWIYVYSEKKAKVESKFQMEKLLLWLLRSIMSNKDLKVMALSKLFYDFNNSKIIYENFLNIIFPNLSRLTN